MGLGPIGQDAQPATHPTGSFRRLCCAPARGFARPLPLSKVIAPPSALQSCPMSIHPLDLGVSGSTVDMRKTAIARTWWRFDRYEIRQRCLCPAPGAKLERYDPWEARRDEAAPFALLHEMATYGDIDEEVAEAAALRWCNRYGLLGLISHHFIAANLVPRWQPVPVGGKVPPAGVAPPLAPEQRAFLQTPTGWTQIRRQPAGLIWGEGGRALRKMPADRARMYSEDQSRLGKVVDERCIPADWPKPGTITSLGVSQPIWGENRRLETWWADFFPGVPPAEVTTYAYAAPGSNQFWHEYGEPMGLFLAAARNLRRLLAILASLRNPYGLSDQDRRQRSRAANDLRGLCLGGLVLMPTDKGYSQKWVGTSLLATLAVMGIQELAADRLRQCTVCKKLFSTEAYQAEYCSPTCRHTHQKRQYRKRLKERSLNAVSRPGKGGRRRRGAR